MSPPCLKIFKSFPWHLGKISKIFMQHLPSDYYLDSLLHIFPFITVSPPAWHLFTFLFFFTLQAFLLHKEPVLPRPQNYWPFCILCLSFGVTFSEAACFIFSSFYHNFSYSESDLTYFLKKYCSMVIILLWNNIAFLLTGLFLSFRTER